MASAEDTERPCVPLDGPVREARSATISVELDVAADFVALVEKCHDLPAVDPAVALLKLGESLRECCRLGLFEELEEVAGGGNGQPQQAKFYLPVQSNLEMILESLGPDSLEQTSCPVCLCRQFKPLLRSQGFSLVRCDECSPVYVNPRLREDILNNFYAEMGYRLWIRCSTRGRHLPRMSPAFCENRPPDHDRSKSAAASGRSWESPIQHDTKPARGKPSWGGSAG